MNTDAVAAAYSVVRSDVNHATATADTADLPRWGTAWHRPPSVEAACAVLGEAGPAARPLAGCTGLPPAALATDGSIHLVVDLLALPELAGIEPTADGIRIGATSTMRAVAESDAVRDLAPMFASAARGIGDEVLQGMATIGGNIAARLPAPFELPVVLVALRASIEIASPEGTRLVAADVLCDPAFRLTPGEVVTAVIVPPARGGWHYRKLTTNVRLSGVACLAVQFAEDRAPAVVTGLGDQYPQRLAAVEEALRTGAAADDLADAAERAVTALRARTDALGSASYRRRALRTLLDEELQPPDRDEH